MSVTPTKHAEINDVLTTVAESHDVRILYACESGSRAWGFASDDSDYDVRFIYVRPTAWYLGIDLADRRDVIEEPIDAELDVSGWDLMKSLNLYRRSNPPLFEWLGSPIVYRDELGLADELRTLAGEFYLPKAAVYHYARMAQNNWRAYLQRASVRTKKYLYALRPLLAVLWIEQDHGVVPTEFSRLVDRIVTDQSLAEAIDELLARKAAGRELGEGPPHPVIHDFLAHHMARLETVTSGVRPEPRGSVDRLNEVFRRCLNAR